MTAAAHTPQGAPPVSVVIATLGGDSLRSTIDHLNAGTLAPAEILVCIPGQEAGRVAGYDTANVRIVVTDCRGQVRQRVTGFRSASHQLVMQLDDDIRLEKNCLELLVQALEAHGPKCAIAPALRWTHSKESVYKKRMHPAVSGLYYWLLNGRSGYRSGSVTQAGTDIGVYADAGGGCVESEWLPGGCVLHRKTNLVLDNYFPFPGKAFSEDLIHSFHLRERSIRLFVDNAAAAYITADPPARTHTAQFWKSLWMDYRSRRYYVELSRRSKLRMHWYYLALILRRLV